MHERSSCLQSASSSQDKIINTPPPHVPHADTGDVDEGYGFTWILMLPRGSLLVTEGDPLGVSMRDGGDGSADGADVY